MPLMCSMPLAASPQGLGRLPTTTMRRPRRFLASSTPMYSKATLTSLKSGSGLLARHRLSLDDLRHERLQLRLKPALCDEGRNDGAANHGGHEDRVLALVDDLVAQAKQ